MPPRRLAALILLALITPLPGRAASTFHVSLAGRDEADGRSPLTAWRTVARVAAQPLGPGDEVRFERGGEWRERLVAGSGGASGAPIVFGAYGAGPRPRFVGGDPVARDRFTPLGDGTYRGAGLGPVHALYRGRGFLRSSRLVLRDADPARNRDHVRSHLGSWFEDGGDLIVNPGGVDPRTDPGAFAVGVREDLVDSNGRDHLVFRDLEVDASARFDGGYGFRIMGSADVRLERCAAYRAGKHHFGVINSTGVVGVDLVAAEAMPDQGAGGASAFVSYSDRTRRGDTSEYHRCVAERLGDPGTGGSYPAFVTHGEGIGSILLDDLTARGGEVALGNDESGAAIRVRGGLLEDATLAVRGRGIVVDGLTIRGKLAGVALDGSGNTLQNVLIVGANPGFAGHQAAITEGGRDNLIRFCTVVMDPAAPDFDAALSLTRRDGRLRWHGNVLITTGTAVRAWFADFDPRSFDAALNFYAPNARFDTRHAGAGGLLTLDRWHALGLDRSSVAGDPAFADPARGDYTPRPGSPLIDKVPPAHRVADGLATDLRGRPRPQGPAADRGAFEAPAP